MSEHSWETTDEPAGETLVLEPTILMTNDLLMTDPPSPVEASQWAQPQADEEIDDEDVYEDVDSALGRDNVSSTASLSASIMEYRTIHGRRYHSARGGTDYWGPNDEIQANSMDLTHHTLTLLFDDKIFLAPIGDDPKKVLDVGCGTDFADVYPHSEVIGTDISPTQPCWIPVNLRFEMDDCNAVPWTFAPSSFDLVHMRYLFGAIRDWDAVYGEALRLCRPGAGWVEAVEPSIHIRSDDGSVSVGDGSALAAWGPLFEEGARKYIAANSGGGGGSGGNGRVQGEAGNSRPMNVVEDGLLARTMRRAGFVDIVQRTFKCPLAPFSSDPRLKEIGTYARSAMEEGMEGFALYLFTKGLGWSKEQVTVYLSRMRRELRDRRKSPYLLVQVVYGRRPETSETIE
ncbi:S-adenosyl-L-methionine-dependent methyltransferase [Hypomontagnella submonticulosa]|nr:S-adenosyl-L-methionine-dependent methyltransferase [Hypomontagnella submonticulosa]